jgi:predicted transcriptional regulator
MRLAAAANGKRGAYGALNSTVIEILLHAESPMTARQIADRLGADNGKEYSLSTILTVLDRLHRAGEVSKVHSAAGEWEFAVTRRDPGDSAEDMIEALLRSADRTGALLSFAGSLDADDRSVLRDIVNESIRDDSDVKRP